MAHTLGVLAMLLVLVGATIGTYYDHRAASRAPRTTTHTEEHPTWP